MAKGKKTGGGSRRGKPNKATAELRDMILGALAEAGGQNYLRIQAVVNPQAFLSLLGRTLPKEIKLDGGLKLEVNLVGVDRSAHG